MFHSRFGLPSPYKMPRHRSCKKPEHSRGQSVDRSMPSKPHAHRPHHCKMPSGPCNASVNN